KSSLKARVILPPTKSPVEAIESEFGSQGNPQTRFRVQWTCSRIRTKLFKQTEPPLSMVAGQVSQFTSMDWASFLKQDNLAHSMSRRGNCHDNAVAESFFNLLNRQRLRRRIYRSRDEARQDVFDYIKMFYNPKRKHVRNGMLSPVEFEKQQKI
ncbi:IS3 family transposase, partial [Ochrobactrum sp. BD67]